MLLWIIVIAAVVVFDQVTKLFVVELLDKTQSLDVIPGILRFTYTENTGMAFGMLGEKNQRWVFMVVSTIAIIAMIIYMWRAKLKSRFANMALCLIIGGGIGNMIDRLFRVGTTPMGGKYYFVVDFIDFYALGDFWVWIFNIADACVCVGAGMMLVWCIKSLVDEYKAEKAAKATATETGGETESADSENAEKKD